MSPRDPLHDFIYSPVSISGDVNLKSSSKKEVDAIEAAQILHAFSQRVCYMDALNAKVFKSPKRVRKDLKKLYKTYKQKLDLLMADPAGA